MHQGLPLQYVPQPSCNFQPFKLLGTVVPQVQADNRFFQGSSGLEEPPPTPLHLLTQPRRRHLDRPQSLACGSGCGGGSPTGNNCSTPPTATHYHSPPLPLPSAFLNCPLSLACGRWCWGGSPTGNKSTFVHFGRARPAFTAGNAHCSSLYQLIVGIVAIVL